MPGLKTLVDDFLALRRIAVAGVSRNDKDYPANLIFRKLRDQGYQVTPVNPRADSVEGVQCYPDLASIPGGVEGLVIATPPEVALALAREAKGVGAKSVWMHRSFGEGSVSEEAVQFCRDNGIAVIAGGCPMMFCQPVDFGHRCMRFVLRLTGGLPDGR